MVITNNNECSKTNLGNSIKKITDDSIINISNSLFDIIWKTDKLLFRSSRRIIVQPVKTLTRNNYEYR